jgi:hypothetical protein
MVCEHTGVFAKHLSNLSTLQSLHISNSQIRLSKGDSNAICCLPSLRSLTIARSESLSLNPKEHEIVPASIESARYLSSLVELSVLEAFLPKDSDLSFPQLTKLYGEEKARGKKKKKAKRREV